MPEAVSSEQALARAVRTWRERRGLTAQQLADRVAKQGGKLSRQAISKAENGERRITLDELAMLARSLDVPPILLVLPIGGDPEVQLWPDRRVPTWDAVKWWIGATGAEGSDGEAILGYFRDHDQLAGGTVLFNREQGEPDLAKRWEERLLDLRKNMRRAGVLPPALPDDLKDLADLEGGTDG